MFHIVDFKAHHHPKEKTVVPDIWLSINNTLCALPPKVSDKELEEMAQKRVEPGPGWQIFGINLLQTFNTYPEAKKELEKTREASKSDDGPQRKRQKSGFLSEYLQDSDNGHRVSSPTTIFKTEFLDLGELSENEWIPPSEVIMIPLGKRKESSERRKEVQGNKVSEEDIPKPVVKKDRKTECHKCLYLHDCIKILKRQCKRLEEANGELRGENASLLGKYKARKTKYRALKNRIKNEEDATTLPSNLVRIGKSTVVEKDRLNLCHRSNYSRFTGDLLEVVFGKEVLSKSSIKGIKGSTKQPLDGETLKDVISFASAKFNLSAAIIRAAVRQKLNVCHKRQQKPNTGSEARARS